ncbi:HNH endonuclease [Snodgrassella alvi]|uniref:HNH nuclease domain-containing protein n=1 Tax=Snodgrassella alvi TaxID=1196083 RepID=A0A2N9XWC4_9NEIS|nr:HNH endonuclease signature motif containing protein [Snodgrassella alvi]PIT53970.1 hypothetical protein BHC49_09230 [Snodgrassella alvi]
MKLTVKASRLMPAGCNSRLPSPRQRKSGKAGVWGRGRGGRPWRRLREAVLLRDRYTCQYCGLVSAEEMEVDHIVNIAAGGTDDMGNLQTLCKVCHRVKTRLESRRG